MAGVEAILRCRALLVLLLLLLIARSIKTQQQDPYYGKQLGDFMKTTHDLAGTVFVSDERTFRISGLHYDGNAIDSYFVLGKKSYNEVSAAGDSPDDTRVRIPDERGTTMKLGRYDNEVITLSLPDGLKIQDFKYLAVWCEFAKEYFGGVDIPNGFAPPAPASIGSFSRLAHDLSSGEITVLDSRTFYIKNLHYDGQGPDAFFYVGNTDRVTHQRSPYGKIRDEQGRSSRLRPYNGQDIVIRLPSTLTVFDIKWLSMWCIAAAQNFGDVRIPGDLSVPPYLEINIDRDGKNCEPLHEDLQVSWIIEGDMINIELAGNIQPHEYMAFGLSGSNSGPSMVGSDVVVADFQETSPRALDYHLSAYSQCANGNGVCPDTKLKNSGENNVVMPTAEMVDGITVIKYSRSLMTNDSVDRTYMNDGTSQQIVWGIGPLNSNDEAAKHTKRITDSKVINFNRNVLDNCPAFINRGDIVKPDFTPRYLYGQDSRTFVFEIGQAGGDQGYNALTGEPSWGIAWYVNGTIVPELFLKRGDTYRFLVYGGKDPEESAKYHPLYLTSSKIGGFQKNESSGETIYPGLVDGKVTNYTVGDYCEWKLTSRGVERSLSDDYIYRCFENFKSDLALKCDRGDEAQYTEFIWTPDQATPDTIYYQCYTHTNLGWKIHVSDDYVEKMEDLGCPVDGATNARASILSVLIILISVLM